MPSFPAMYVPRAGSADALDPAAPAIQVAQVPTLTLSKISDAGSAASHAASDFDAAGAAAAAQAASQPLDSDLTAIAALATTAFGRGVLIVADATALRGLAGLGTAAVANTGTAAGNVAIFAGGALALGTNTIGATNLAGTIALARIPSLPASQITSGVFGTSLLGTGGGHASNFLNGTGAFTAPAPYDQSLNSTDDVTFNTVHIAGAGSIQASGSEFYFPSAAETAGRFVSGVLGLGVESGTVTINAAQADQVEMNLAADVTIANPTSPKNGQGLLIIFTQAGGGGWLITLDTDFSDPFGTATAINGRTADGAVNLMSAIYNSALGKWLVMPDLGGAY